METNRSVDHSNYISSDMKIKDFSCDYTNKMTNGCDITQTYIPLPFQSTLVVLTRSFVSQVASTVEETTFTLHMNVHTEF